MTSWDDIRSCLQVINASNRTVICSRKNESWIKTLVDAQGMGGIIKVLVNDQAPDDRIYVINEQARADRPLPLILASPDRPTE